MKQGIAFGIYSVNDDQKRVAAKIQGHIVDLYLLAQKNAFDGIGIDPSVFENDFLNEFIRLGKEKTNKVLDILHNLHQEEYSSCIVPMHLAVLHLPVNIGDYTDFYSSEQHAYNVGVMFRDPDNALLPNWKHLPVAYHGRSSSIFVSGQNFHRPKGQINSSDTTPPIFSETKRLDIELEMATIIGKNNEIGNRIDVLEAEDYVFGFSLFNDWSARDIQRWEYVPLGPFLAKNFFSSISAWVIPIEELAPFRVDAEQQSPEVLPYLKEKNRKNFDITLEVYLIPHSDKTDTEVLICQSNFKNMYWTVAQQIAHHTVNGCNLRIGDIMGSGTISGKSPDSYGSLLELSWGGKNPISLPDGSTRTFLEDGDTIIIRGHAQNDDYRVDFGEIRTTILPSK
jgi:fumarylacetoacetase